MDKVYSETQKLQAIIDTSSELKEYDEDYGDVLDFVGDASVVLLGESTRGSLEFYRTRANITKMLIQKKGFKAVAATYDFSTSERLNNFAQMDSSMVSHKNSKTIGHKNYADLFSAQTTPFPSWIFENNEMAKFFSWLRTHNEGFHAQSHKIGFYGLDLYNFYDSASQVIKYFDHLIPSAAAAARNVFASYEIFGTKSSRSKRDSLLNLGSSLESASVSRLVERLKNQPAYLQIEDGPAVEGEFLNRTQKLRVIAGAEKFYRCMLRNKISFWELRDSHMAEALQKVRQNLEHRGESPKVVVWAHNFDSGDAQATELSRLREVNFGQLVKHSYGHESVSIGLTTYVGTVTASSSWNGAAETKVIPPAPSTSYEYLFHKTGIPRFFLEMKHDSEATHALRDPQNEMVIGALLAPRAMRANQFFSASIPFQFDAIVHIDRTRGLENLEGAAAENLFPASPIHDEART